ncbi:tripartite tricarboxylate transporter TctB family protein [Halomonas huangheensis]|uniref:DUF1468 domain-containing protein n=1 Tax=Halomonas huangheensis TaxID=1178482 RepID=W1NBJ9_9GAMM|nr:tripartite tricarboxylate transporter TctB family protein [Halomonas huangheensis]ALM52642.1 hypothetical protein AR456_10395 [Halomonas huangheensis]ERL52838.1 hypothetical protein BJB45_16295 [Halomonas huangheensis]
MGVERILLALLALLGAAFVLGGQGLAFRADIAFGPGFVPVVTGAALALSCVVQALRQRRRSAAASSVHGSNAAGVDDQSLEDHRPNYRGMLLALAILVAGAAAMVLGSVLIPVFIITVLLSWLVLGHGLGRSLVVAVGTNAVIYVIFALWLGLPVQ